MLLVGDSAVNVDESGLRFVSPSEVPSGERFLLGVDEDVAYFGVAVDGAPDVAVTLREAGAILGDRDAGLAVQAVALANWHEAHQYCPRCGTRTESRRAGHVRRCPADGVEQFPRTDPAVIVLVIDEHDRCLLGRAVAWPQGRFSTLAGFVEAGETPEHAVVREVYEESRVTVTSSTYAGAQPWPFPSSLMLGYFARAAGVEPCPDGDEIAEARWFSRADLADAADRGEVILPGGVSIARRLVEGWYGDDLPVTR